MQSHCDQMSPKFVKPLANCLFQVKKKQELPSFVYVAASSESDFGAATSSDQRIYTFDIEKAMFISDLAANTGPITDLAISY